MDLKLCQLILPGANSKAGYDWLQWAWMQGAFHPGWDFNLGVGYDDFNLPLYTPCDGIVRYVSEKGNNGGFGLHLYLEHPELHCYSHWCHLQNTNVVLGQKVFSGQNICRLGRSGTTSPHLHFEVQTKELFEKQKKHKTPYCLYPVGWRKSEVQKYYIDPAIFLKSCQEIILYRKKMADQKIVADWAKESWEWGKKTNLINKDSIPGATLTKQELMVILFRFQNFKN